MASATSLSSLSTFVDGRASRQPAAASPQCVSLPSLPPPAIAQSQSRAAKTSFYCRKITRNVVAMATGDMPAMTTEDVPPPPRAEMPPPPPAEMPPPPPPEVTETDLPDVMKTIQGAWDKVEDKYAVSSLAVAAFLALWVSSGLLSAIDRLPLVPGVLELVGIGYTVWFAYQNLVFTPNREALFGKIKETYNEITGIN